jgi:hypothetical protein
LNGFQVPDDDQPLRWTSFTVEREWSVKSRISQDALLFEQLPLLVW